MNAESKVRKGRAADQAEAAANELRRKKRDTTLVITTESDCTPTPRDSDRRTMVILSEDGDLKDQ